LKEINLNADYLQLLRDYKNVCKDEKNASRVMLDIAEGEIARAQYDEAEKILNELIIQPAIKKTALMTAIKNDLAEIAYRKGLYDKAIGDFDSVINSGQAINDPGSTYMHYADALKRKKDNSRALQNYLIAVKYLSQDRSSAAGAGDAYKETGDLYFNTSNYKDSLDMYNKALARSPNTDLKYWSLFNAGQSYMKLENNTEAQKTFARIKTEAGPEGFWTKVVDYHVDNQKWWDKYGEYLRK
jgi:tetratricopeptide (TPR) repeat protein